MEKLSGNSTRMKIYYYLLKQKRPVSIKKIQRDLKISSPSLVYYHIKKLEEEGLIKETPEGYVVQKIILSEFIKVRNYIIPISAFWASFFLTGLILMITFLAIGKFVVGDIFGIVISAIASGIFIYDILKKYKDVIV